MENLDRPFRKWTWPEVQENWQNGVPMYLDEMPIEGFWWLVDEEGNCIQEFPRFSEENLGSNF